MKKMKKIISLILAVLMMLSVVPVQSFALFDFLNKAPKVARVEVVDDTPLSLKRVEENIYDADEENEEICISNYLDTYSFKYKIYMEDGGVEETTEMYPTSDTLTGEDRYLCGVTMRLVPAEFRKALAEGKQTFPVEFEVCIGYENRFGQECYESYFIDYDMRIVEQYVINITAIDEISPDDEFSTVRGKRFEVEYYDGRKEIYTVGTKGGDFAFDNEKLIHFPMGSDVAINEETGEEFYYDGYTLEYCDFKLPLIYKVIPKIYSNFELTGYKYDGNGLLRELSCRITYADGRVLEKSYTFDDGEIEDGYAVIDTIDGNELKVHYYVYDEEFNMTVNFGYNAWELSAEVVEEIESACDCVCHKYGFYRIIFIIKCIFWILTFTNQTCQCGSEHYQ